MTMTRNEDSDLEKRNLSDDASFPTTLSKKRKTEAFSPAREVSQQKVNSSELASAFALASLAGMTSFASKEIRETQGPADGGVQNATSWEETRSPKATQAPTSPDERLPGSPRAQKMQEEEPGTPESSKRVHFAPNTKEKSSPTPPAAVRGAVQVSRRLLLPAHLQGNGAFMGGPRGPMHYGAFNSAMAYRSPPHMQHHPMHSPPHAPYHHAPQPWFHSPAMAANMAGRMAYPPQRLMQPALVHPENEWICDFCNVASFSSYEQACIHEEACRVRCASRIAREKSYSRQPQGYPGIQANSSLMSRSGSGEEDGMDRPCSPITPANSDNWHSGSLSLAMGEPDSEWLSELNCFVRSHCVEAFSATEDDVVCSSKRGRIALHQVGIRCRFCVNIPAKDRAVAAVSFPTSVGGIYESVKRWQRVHLEVCDSVPQSVRNKLDSLGNTNVLVPTTRQYWSDSARAMGLVDTTEGIRFGIDPNEISTRIEVGMKMATISRRGMIPAAGGESPGYARGALAHSMSSMPSIEPSLSCTEPIDDTSTPAFLVFPDDMEMIPPYVYFLMRQVEPCLFTEADRFVARSKGPVGYPGFQCRHCKGHAGLGKYFPVSAKSLSTNSTSQNIHAHLLKCRKCPEGVKDRLVQLKIDKGRSPRLEPGWRKVFFDKVWGRLHV